MVTHTDFAIYTRDGVRHRPPDEVGAYVEFLYPEHGGDRWRFDLVDLSRGGLAFVLPAILPGLTVGTELCPVVLGQQGVRILGDLRIRHITADFDERTVCGGRFCPTTTVEQRKMEQLLGSFDESAPDDG